jgi:hypothetical protein
MSVQNNPVEAVASVWSRVLLGIATLLARFKIEDSSVAVVTRRRSADWKASGSASTARRAS